MKILKIMSLVALAALVAGCMQVRMETVIEKDGSGTYTMTYSVSQDVEQALQELQAMDSDQMDMGDMPDFVNMDKDAMADKLKDSGAKLTEFSNKVVDGRRTVRIATAVKDVNTLPESMGAVMGSGDSSGIVKLDDGNYELRSVEIEMDEPEEEEAAGEQDMEDMSAAMENAAKSMEIMGKLMAHSSELEMVMTITFPSEIISHNAHRVEGKTCIWEINSENMMSAQGLEPKVVFSGKGVKIKERRD